MKVVAQETGNGREKRSNQMETISKEKQRELRFFLRVLLHDLAVRRGDRESRFRFLELRLDLLFRERVLQGPARALKVGGSNSTRAGRKEETKK